MAGSVLGTAIIVGSLIVGDTLNFSVQQTAYKNLGPIDEIVSSPTVRPGRPGRPAHRAPARRPRRGRAADPARRPGRGYPRRRHEPQGRAPGQRLGGRLRQGGRVPRRRHGGSGLSGPALAPARRSSTTTWPPSSRGPGRGQPHRLPLRAAHRGPGGPGRAQRGPGRGAGPGRPPPATPSSLPAPWSRRPAKPRRPPPPGAAPLRRTGLMAPPPPALRAHPPSRAPSPSSPTPAGSRPASRSDAVAASSTAALGPLTAQGTSVRASRACWRPPNRPATASLPVLVHRQLLDHRRGLLLVNIFVMLAEGPSRLGMLRRSA